MHSPSVQNLYRDTPPPQKKKVVRQFTVIKLCPAGGAVAHIQSIMVPLGYFLQSKFLCRFLLRHLLLYYTKTQL